MKYYISINSTYIKLIALIKNLHVNIYDIRQLHRYNYIVIIAKLYENIIIAEKQNVDIFME